MLSFHQIFVHFLLFTFTGLSFGKTFLEDLTLTREQKLKLDKFKELVISTVALPHDYMKEDVYLIRWLRARDYNAENARMMLIENLVWRKENKMDMILLEDWSYYAKNFPYSLQGRDREGKPVLYLNIGSMDFRKEVVAGKLDRLLRYVNKGLEEASTLVRELGTRYHNVSQGILILNVEGFSLTKHACLRCVPAILSIMKTYENYYPGLADKIFVINMPMAAEPILIASRRLLQLETQQALQVYGTNRKLWLEALTRSIDLSELPVDLGGFKPYNNSEVDDY